MISFTTFLLNEWITLGWLINYGKGKLDVKLLQPIPLKVISCYIKATDYKFGVVQKIRSTFSFPMKISKSEQVSFLSTYEYNFVLRVSILSEKNVHFQSTKHYHH